MELKEIQYGESSRFITDTNRYWVYSNLGKYLDVALGNTAFVWGYKHPNLIEALNRGLNDVNFIRGRVGETCEIVEQVNAKLLSKTKMSSILWAVSGSDAIEASLEIAWQWHNSTDKKYKVLSFSHNYHGCTWMPKALRGERPWQEYVVISPSPRWRYRYQRQEAEQKALYELIKTLDREPEVGTIIIESMPWMVGFKDFSSTWWSNLRKICDARDLLLILDDVACGFGKLAPYSSSTRFNIKPDIVALGKSITGGMVPLSCTLASGKLLPVLEKLRWYHGHTWQPYVPGVHVVNEIIDMVSENNWNFLRLLFDDFIETLKREELIIEDRGYGLMREIIFSKRIKPEALEKSGIVTNQMYRNNLGIGIPLIADSEYFGELNSRVRALATYL